MLNTSAFQFLYGGNLAFVVKLRFIMQLLCFTLPPKWPPRFFVNSFFHSRQSRKFSIFLSHVVVITCLKEQLKRLGGVWFRNRLRGRNRTYDNRWHFLCSNFLLAFSMTISRLIDENRRDFASLLRQIATGLEWVASKDVWECDLVKVARDEAKQKDAREWAVRRDARDWAALKDARDWAMFNTVLITGCTTNWRANWYCIQFYWRRSKRNGVLSVCGTGLFVVGWGGDGGILIGF